LQACLIDCGLLEATHVRKLARTCKPLIAQCAGVHSPKQNFPVYDIAELRDELRRVVQMLAALAKAASEGERSSFTLKEFQRRHNLSESQFFKLCREGHGPRLMSVGSVGKRVSREADRDWIAAREIEAEAGARKIAPTEETGDREGRPADDSQHAPARE
jgi:hypothetical protein